MLPKALIFLTDGELWISRIESGLPLAEIKRVVKTEALAIRPNELHIMEFECVEGETVSLYRLGASINIITLPCPVESVINAGRFWEMLRNLQKSDKVFTDFTPTEGETLRRCLG